MVLTTPPHQVQTGVKTINIHWRISIDEYHLCRLVYMVTEPTPNENIFLDVNRRHGDCFIYEWAKFCEPWFTDTTKGTFCENGEDYV